MLTGPVVAASVTFLLALPPVLYVQIRRGAIPRRRWLIGAGAWTGVFCLTLFGLTGGSVAVTDPRVATTLDGLALVAGVVAVGFFGYYRRAERRAGVT